MRYRLVILLLGMAQSLGCASLSKVGKSQASQDDLPTPMIDAHVHTYFTDEPDPDSGIMDSQEEFLKELKAAGGVGAISHAPPGKTDFLDLRSYGVIHCAGIGERINLKEVRDGLRTGRYGCIKIYLGYIHRWASDPAYEPLYQMAEEFDVAVVFHTGDTDSDAPDGLLKYADPLTVDEVAVVHPKVRFVLAHCGNPWIQSAAEVAFKNSNVWLDGSALKVGDLTKRTPQSIDSYIVQPLAWVFGYLDDPKKLMFGTDWPLVNISEYARAFKRAIPQEHWHAVFYENAVRVFKIRPPQVAGKP